MHPYMIEQLAAAHRDELQSTADRHRLAVQARRHRTPTGPTVTAVIIRAIAAVVRAATNRPRRQADRQQSSRRARPAPW